jgi:peptide chain release factor 2
MNKQEIENKIKEIETAMNQADFWNDSLKAQKLIKELQNLRDELLGENKYDKGNAVVTIFSGVGGDDAEDFVRMLLEMYMGYAKKNNWQINFLDENKNTNGGYKTVTFEILGKGVYGNLKHESGVHRLVRKSPFNSAGKRQTSFAMVETIPEFKEDDFKIPEEELEIEFTKSSGPGGQNVNKRETAVRIVHKSTGLSAFVSSERSQAQNRQKAMEIISGKFFTLKEKEKRGEIDKVSISKTTTAEWGSQIRSYVLHPYKLVKDHRTGTETSSVDSVLSGEIDLFIQSMKEYKD